MGARQARQRPRSSSQPATGTLSRQATGVPQEGQRDPGRTSVSRRGTRWMTTWANDPAARPRRPASEAAASGVMAGKPTCPRPVGERFVNIRRVWLKRRRPGSRKHHGSNRPGRSDRPCLAGGGRVRPGPGRRRVCARPGQAHGGRPLPCRDPDGRLALVVATSRDLWVAVSGARYVASGALGFVYESSPALTALPLYPILTRSCSPRWSPPAAPSACPGRRPRPPRCTCCWSRSRWGWPRPCYTWSGGCSATPATGARPRPPRPGRRCWWSCPSWWCTGTGRTPWPCSPWSRPCGWPAAGAGRPPGWPSGWRWRPSSGPCQGDRDRLEVAQLADLALVDQAALVGVEELDRVLDGHDVVVALPVGQVDQAGQGGRLARAGGPGDQHEAPGQAGEAAHLAGDAERLQRLDLLGDQPEGGPDRVALEVDVEPEPGLARQGVGAVELLLALQPLALPLGEDRVDHRLGLGRLEHRVVLQRAQAPVHPHGRLGPGGQVQVGGAQLEHLLEQLGHPDPALGSSVPQPHPGRV